VCRNPSGEIRTYPVVEMEFHPEANQVEYVICPARIDDAVAEKARAIALHVSENSIMDYWLLKCSKLKTMKF
jgi:5-(carboxyamino)imidazole ribonucleotide synthase